VSARAFSLNPGEVSEALRASRGIVFETLADKKDAYIPKLDEVKDRVHEVVIGQRAHELASKRPPSSLRRSECGGFRESGEGRRRRGQDDGIADARHPQTRARGERRSGRCCFKLPLGGISDPIPTQTGAAVAKVVEKQETTAADVTLNKETFREDLLADRRNRFFSAYM